MAVVGAVAAGTLAAPDYITTELAHNIQQTCVWLAGIFAVINPFLDIGAGDAKGGVQKDA